MGHYRADFGDTRSDTERERDERDDQIAKKLEGKTLADFSDLSIEDFLKLCAYLDIEVRPRHCFITPDDGRRMLERRFGLNRRKRKGARK